MNNLRYITFTGAGDQNDVMELVEIAKSCPGIEFGILVSAKLSGQYDRYPSYAWIKQLTDVASMCPMNLSLHVCGKFVRDILVGNLTLPEGLHEHFQRIQLNFHDESIEYDVKKCAALLKSMGEKQFIFQIDSTNGNKVFESLLTQSLYENLGLDLVPLFDKSGGNGVVPASWPPIKYTKDGKFIMHGYAGGLGPDNFLEEYERICAATVQADDSSYVPKIWVDCETKVFSPNEKGGEIFNLTKVLYCYHLLSKNLLQSVRLIGI